MAKTITNLKSNFTIALLLLSFVCSSQIKTDSIKQNFISAKNEIEAMLSGKLPLDYERAVFITENAYHNDSIDYSEFKQLISLHLENINLISKSTKTLTNITTRKNILISSDSAQKNITNAVNNYAIFKYLTDTTTFLFESELYYHPSFQYSFSDPFATINWESSQVTTLLDFNKHYGNCNALVSLFKIFSQRLNSNSLICTAPSHVFIRHADENGIFYNVELATKSFPGTGSIETITYTTDEAARSGIAMRELDLKQSIGLLLINLAKAYEHKLNNKSDDFILDCAEQCLKYDSLNLNAMLLKAEFLNERITQLNTPIKKLQNNPDFIEYQKQITMLYNLGYREMPVEMKNQLVSALMKDSSYVAYMPNKTYNPFANSYKSYDRSYSLSNGMFEEVNKIKPKEQYFNTIFDTKTKRIVELIKKEVLYNKYDFDPVVFALSIDPLASKYPSISPYAAMGNNPIIMIDDDGRDYGVYIDKEKKTITIRTVIYIAEGDDISAKRAEGVKADFEAVNGKFSYKTEGGEVYAILFETNIQKVAEVVYSYGPNGENAGKTEITALSKANADPIGNSLQKLPPNDISGALGKSNDGDNMEVATNVSEKKGKKITRHETLHILGVSHKLIGMHGARVKKEVIGTILQNATNKSSTNKIEVVGVKDKNFVSKDTQGGTNPNTNITTSDNTKIELKGEIIKN